MMTSSMTARLIFDYRKTKLDDVRTSNPVHLILDEAHRYISSVLPYFSDDSTTIKQAEPGEALIFGNCVPMPLMVKVSEANPAPNSSNCDIRKEWFGKSDEVNGQMAVISQI